MNDALCKTCFKQGGASVETEARTSMIQKAIDGVKRNPSGLSAKQKELFQRMHSVELTVSASKKDRWDKVSNTWEMAASFVKSQVSGIFSDPVSPEVLATRKKSCFGSDTSVACPSLALSQDGQHHFCNDCGCGDREIAYLDGGKLEYPYLECPRKRPGFSNYEPGSIVFDCTEGGIGDIVVHLWHAAGYAAAGQPCSFYTPPEKVRDGAREIIRLFGGTLTDHNPEDSYIVGGDSLGNRFEYRYTKGEGTRHEVWASQYPNNPKPTQPPINLLTSEVEKAKAELQEPRFKGKPCVLLFPFADWSARMWPLAYWLDLAYQLEARGIATRTMAPSNRVEDIKPFPLWEVGASWNRIAACMSVANLVIGNDSGAAHVSATLKRPTIAIMGATRNVFSYYPTAVEVSLPQEILSCSGCHFQGSRGFRKACDKACRALMLLPPEQITELCCDMLKPADK